VSGVAGRGGARHAGRDKGEGTLPGTAWR